MKRLGAALLLFAAASVQAARVYVPEAGVYVDTDSGEAYPSVAPNVAIDPNTGRAFVPAAEGPPRVSRSTGQATDAMRCSAFSGMTAYYETQLRSMDPSTSAYADIYAKWQNSANYNAKYCR